jgi:hypothetical protein
MVSSPLSALERGAMRTVSSRAADKILEIDLFRMVCEVRRGGYTLPRRKN